MLSAGCDVLLPSEDICKKVKKEGAAYKDCAVLYRTNAQARLLEERMIMEGVPYNVVGGTNFYARAEIKDILAYLKTVDNGRDEVAVRRILNVPKRGIGAATVEKLEDYAQMRDIGLYDAMELADEIMSLGKTAAKIRPFVQLIRGFRKEALTLSVAELIQHIVEKIGYAEYLQDNYDEDGDDRLENVEELITKAVNYQETHEEPNLTDFLAEVALVAEIDNVAEDDNRVLLMTLHSAKGLEFPNVYLAGMEDGLFPSYMTIISDDHSDIEEERRLAYVGITRAKENLTLTCARRRMVHGETQYNKMSRFLKEIPLSLLSTGALFKKEQTEEEPKVSTYRQAKQAFATKAFAATKPAQQFTVTKGKGPGYDVGDRVRHIKFGEGLVTQITEGGRDYEVTVDFDTAGTKKMFAMFAKLQKID